MEAHAADLRHHHGQSPHSPIDERKDEGGEEGGEGGFRKRSASSARSFHDRAESSKPEGRQVKGEQGGEKGAYTQLIQDESMYKGGIGAAVYWKHFKHMGIIKFFFFIVLAFLAQAFVTGSSFVLSWWSTNRFDQSNLWSLHIASFIFSAGLAILWSFHDAFQPF